MPRPPVKASQLSPNPGSASCRHAGVELNLPESPPLWPPSPRGAAGLPQPPSLRTPQASHTQRMRPELVGPGGGTREGLHQGWGHRGCGWGRSRPLRTQPPPIARGRQCLECPRAPRTVRHRGEAPSFSAGAAAFLLLHPWSCTRLRKSFLRCCQPRKAQLRVPGTSPMPQRGGPCSGSRCVLRAFCDLLSWRTARPAGCAVLLAAKDRLHVHQGWR